MRIVSLFVLSTLAALAAPAPNIVILYADDMGYGDLGANNPASKIPTPHLDRLASEGLRFSDAHSSSGICTPSRYSLLTGRHHWRDFHGIANSFDPTVFRKGQLTLPRMLHEKGYATACIGKWHLGWDWNAIRKPGTSKNSVQHRNFDWSLPIPDGPLDHGFDHYFGDDVINFPPYAWIKDNKLVKAPDTQLAVILPKTPPKEGGWECRPGPACSDWDFYQNLPTLAKKAVEYIGTRRGNEQPFFLYLPFPSPHAPIIPTNVFDGKSKAGPFGDYVVQTDNACGQVLAALKENGFDSNTIVVFSADNGPEFYAYERDRKYDHWSSEPYRGLKRDIYEGGHHVPFLIKWPGITKPGTSDALICQTDLMATLASFCGYQLPENSAEDSYDLLPYLKGESAKPPRDTLVHNTHVNAYAIRHKHWLLINAKSGDSRPAAAAWLEKHLTPKDHGTPVELYDLKKDPSQRTNLAHEHPETVKELQLLLAKARSQGHTAPRLE